MADTTILETDPKVMREALEKQPWSDPLWVGEAKSASHFAIRPYQSSISCDVCSLYMWEMPAQSESYTAAVDPASGIANGDPAAIQIVRSGKCQVAEVLLQGFSIAEQARLAVWLSQFYNNATLIVESNAFGSIVGNIAVEMGYKNVWHDDVMHVGFLMTLKRRRMLIGELQASLKNGSFLRSKRLLGELLQFSESTLSQDDLTSAMLIAHGLHGKARF